MSAIIAFGAGAVFAHILSRVYDTYFAPKPVESKPAEVVGLTPTVGN